MKYFLVLFGLLISGCTSNKYIGTWVHDGESERAAFIFEENGKCAFVFAAKQAIDGISPACTYNVKENIIEVLFEPNPKSKEQDIMFLEYKEANETLISKESNMGYQFVFIKDPNGL